MQASPSLSNHPSTRRGLPIMHSNRSKAGSSAISWPLARHKVSHTALIKCRWPCQLGSTDQLRTTPDLMVSTGELLWPKTTTPSRTTQAVILKLVSRSASAEGEMRPTLPKPAPEASEQSLDSLVPGRLQEARRPRLDGRRRNFQHPPLRTLAPQGRH